MSHTHSNEYGRPAVFGPNTGPEAAALLIRNKHEGGASMPTLPLSVAEISAQGGSS